MDITGLETRCCDIRMVDPHCRWIQSDQNSGRARLNWARKEKDHLGKPKKGVTYREALL